MGIRGWKTPVIPLGKKKTPGSAGKLQGKDSQAAGRAGKLQEKPQEGPQSRRRKRVVPQAISFIAFGATLFSCMISYKIFARKD